MGFDLFGLAVLAFFVILLIIFVIIDRRRPAVFRPIPGYESLRTAVERAVEAGERVHVSLGVGSVIGTDSAPALAGLSMVQSIASRTMLSDRPMVVTAGDGAMSLLAQGTLRAAYARAGALDRFKPTAARMLGPTPWSYVASLPILLSSEQVSAHILAGSFGAEGALAADFGRKRRIFVLGGTDDAQSQALLFATADYPLIGEEIFAGGAYLDLSVVHRASLRVQDAARVVVVAGILIAALLRIFGVGA